MTIRERAAAALVRAREAGYRYRRPTRPTGDGCVRRWPATSPPCSRCPRPMSWWATTRSAVGGVPGQMITVDDPDDRDLMLRFSPETGNTGLSGGAYLLLDVCPGCGGHPRTRGEVPMVAITGLAELGNYRHRLKPRSTRATRRVLRRPRIRTRLPTPITHHRAIRPPPSARYGLQTQRPDPHPTSQMSRVSVVVSVDG